MTLLLPSAFAGVVVGSALVVVGWRKKPRSSWRQAAVGAATVALSIFAFVTGFSIGVVFVPLVIAMVLVSFSHLRRLTQVDSPL